MKKLLLLTSLSGGSCFAGGIQHDDPVLPPDPVADENYAVTVSDLAARLQADPSVNGIVLTSLCVENDCIPFVKKPTPTPSPSTSNPVETLGQSVETVTQGIVRATGGKVKIKFKYRQQVKDKDGNLIVQEVEVEIAAGTGAGAETL